MRWLFFLSALLFAGPAFAQPNEAEKLYRAFEKKLADAKTAYKFEFDFDLNSRDTQLKIKGDLTVAAGNQMRISFAGSQTRAGMAAMPMIATMVSNGQQMGMKMSGAGKEDSKTDAVPKELTTYLKGYLPAAGVYFGMEGAMRPQPEATPDKIKIGAFQLAAKEKIGDKQTQIVEYTLDFPGAKGTGVCKVWIDLKTNLPVKRVIDLNQAGENNRLVEEYRNWQIDSKLPADEFALPK